ncbi:MAG: CoB--CoM heterodisulfide reductase iron-sulfur subunit A family protein [Thermodesulforhabdaceae bacterium]
MRKPTQRRILKPEDVRIGVFVCHCGSNIAGYLDCKEVADYAATLPGVVFSTTNLYTCSESGIAEIKRTIEEKKLTRVVVASCSPRTHEPLFKSSCKEAGLNPYLFEMVNIRDQCSWVHMNNREEATEKAKNLVRMGVAKAWFLEPQEDIEMPIEARVAVIGGGVAGLSAAESLADMGVSVVLIEKSPQLGGLTLRLNSLAPHLHNPDDLLKPLIERVEHHPGIKLYKESSIRSIEGYVGNYRIELDTKDQGVVRESVSAVVVAIGAKPYMPDRGNYGYDGEKVITQFELEQKLKDGSIGNDIRHVVMIQCVGARSTKEGEKTYCGRICCATAVKNAVILKERFPDIKVSILYRDMQTYGSEFEAMLWKARSMGIKFYVYDQLDPPTIKDNTVLVKSKVFSDEVQELPVDLVVLSTPLVASDEATGIAGFMRIPTDANHFFLEAHVKLRPLDFATDGVFLCGSCRFPCTAEEARIQGMGAAARAVSLLAKGKVVSSALVAEVDASTCCGCQGCLRICPYGAITYDENRHVCQVNPILCKGCGACTAACPSQSVQLKGFKPKQLLSQVRATMESLREMFVSCEL